MKKTIITIALLFNLCYAAKNKVELLECRKENQKLNEVLAKIINSNEEVSIDYPTSRKDVKQSKIKAKEVVKVARIESKTIVKTDKFRNFLNSLTRITALLVSLSLFGGGVAFGKFTTFLKSNVRWLSWLPI